MLIEQLYDSVGAAIAEGRHAQRFFYIRGVVKGSNNHHSITRGYNINWVIVMKINIDIASYKDQGLLDVGG